LLLHEAADGAWNMAVDEAILQSYVDAATPMAPTLRLYGWRPAALSLGKGQDASHAHDPAYLRAEGIDLVRRPTGGLAVLHEHERTYAVIGALAQQPFSASVLENYQSVARALRLAMSLLGADAEAISGGVGSTAPPKQRSGPACFDLASAYEIAVKGRKLIGSAQLRRRRAFLQHGSILLDCDAARLSLALGGVAQSDRFTDLRRVLGRIPETRELDGALIEAWESRFETTLAPGELTAEENNAAEQLRSTKYAGERWTLMGRATHSGNKNVPGEGVAPERDEDS
jgi:lipoate-protein ligase A